MPSKLILMRHGQSIWNKLNLFTGWVDIPLSEEGIQEVLMGGRKMKNTPINAIFTSTLIRAHMTVVFALLDHESRKIPVFQRLGVDKPAEWSKIYSEEMRDKTVPVYMAWEFNERMYGQLQGFNKAETAKKFGDEQVRIWRRSYDAIPPGGESLEMTVKRSLPYFQKYVVPHLERGENVFIAAHGNSLRGIVMYLENLSKEEVVNLEIPTGEPLFYMYDQGKWKKEF